MFCFVLLHSRDGKCASPEDWKTDQDKENALDVVKVDERESLNGEEPLRRSPRKQYVPVAAETLLPSLDSAQSEQPQQREISAVEADSRERHRSRVKHRKTRVKHHKDKRSKRKHSKNMCELKNVTSSDALKDVFARIESEPTDHNAISKICKTNFASVPKLIVERLSMKEQDVSTDVSRSSENCSTVLTENRNKRKNEPAISTEEDTTTSITENRDEHRSLQSVKRLREESNCDLEPPTEVCHKDDSAIVESPKMKYGITARKKSDEKEKVLSVEVTKKKTNDEKRPKKKRKHPKQESSRVENQGGVTSTPVVKEILHKRHKKKHKHATEHKTKRNHDVRKAPHDGKIATSEGPELDEVTRVASAVAIASNVALSVSEVEGIVTEPQRLAIKIKLCQDCNERHIEDACPLVSTEYAIVDAVAYKDWLNVHKHNPEVSKAMASEDPMSEGYPLTNDDAFESDEESANSEQYKNKTKVESEDKQLHVNEDRPLYSRESLPDCFELRITSPEHGIGIYARRSLPMYAKLGPLVGDPVKEMDIPDDFSMRHIWEVNFVASLLSLRCWMRTSYGILYFF